MRLLAMPQPTGWATIVMTATLVAALGASACNSEREARAAARASLGAHLGDGWGSARLAAPAAEDVAAARRSLAAAVRADPNNVAARAALFRLLGAPSDLLADALQQGLAPPGASSSDRGLPSSLVDVGARGVMLPSAGRVSARRVGEAFGLESVVGVTTYDSARVDLATSAPDALARDGEAQVPKRSSTPDLVASPASPATRSAAGEVIAAGPASARAGSIGAPPDAGSDAGPGAAGTVSSNASTEAAIRAAGVQVAITEYGQAIEARDLAALQRVYPDMPEDQRRAWASFFGSVSDLHARLEVGDLVGSGATARARVHGTYEYQNLRPHRTERVAVHFVVTLSRAAAGWRLRTVE